MSDKSIEVDPLVKLKFHYFEKVRECQKKLDELKSKVDQLEQFERETTKTTDHKP